MSYKHYINPQLIFVSKIIIVNYQLSTINLIYSSSLMNFLTTFAFNASSSSF